MIYRKIKPDTDNLWAKIFLKFVNICEICGKSFLYYYYFINFYKALIQSEKIGDLCG